jgi:DNA-binding response OmpR family regulator
MALKEIAGPHRIAVVDDSPELLALMGDALGFDGAEIALLGSDTTVDDIVATVPDLLVLDLRFGADGFVGLDIIRRARLHLDLRHVPIIVCSAALDALIEHEAELSATPNLSILPKPFSLTDLEACVGEALAGRRRTAAAG